MLLVTLEAGDQEGCQLIRSIASLLYASFAAENFPVNISKDVSECSWPNRQKPRLQYAESAQASVTGEGPLQVMCTGAGTFAHYLTTAHIACGS